MASKPNQKKVFSAEREEFDIIGIFKDEIKKIESSLQQIDDIYKKDLRWFDRFSDSIAEVGGSWGFIVIFILIIIAWVLLNGYLLVAKPFDPFPFVLLNLVLSCVAALQAPVILMSQSRAAKRDQARVEMDLEKDLRDLKIDRASHQILLQLQKDVNLLKKKADVK